MKLPWQRGQQGASPQQGAYWSGETLGTRLPSLIRPSGSFRSERIDCASYRLSIGPEIYVTPTADRQDPATVTARKLELDEAFAIPAGQFALLLTEEVIEIPNDSIGFISIRAKTKFKGLVNVSGFHVDPGFKGQLTFAVFNAAPGPIHLRRGQEIFVLWFADLDQPSSYVKDEPVRLGLDIDMIQGIPGELQSFASLGEKIKEVDKRLTSEIITTSTSLHGQFRDLQLDLRGRMDKAESKQRVQTWINTVAGAVFVLVAGVWLRSVFDPAAQDAVSPTPATIIVPGELSPKLRAPANEVETDRPTGETRLNHGISNVS